MNEFGSEPNEVLNADHPIVKKIVDLLKQASNRPGQVFCQF